MKESGKLIVTPKMIDYPFIDFFTKDAKERLSAFRNLQDLERATLKDLLLEDEMRRLKQYAVIEIEREELEVRFIRLLNQKTQQKKDKEGG